MEISPAILMRRTKLTETSFVVTWFTEFHGKLKTVAKGARRPKSPFAGKLDLFFDAEIQWSRSSKSDLHALKEVVLRHPHEGIRGDFRRVELGCYFVELMELLTEPEHPAPELYDLLRRAFGYLDAAPATKRAMQHFESELTRLLGIHGKPGQPAALALGQAGGRLPKSRHDLLERLE
jgi:DNA repair protein RecO (recombination protein O)